MFDIDLKPCDILPLIPVIKGAGCEIIELKNPIKISSLVCSKDIYQDIIEIINGAGEGIRTLDIHLGKVVLYQLSYARKTLNTFVFFLVTSNNYFSE